MKEDDVAIAAIGDSTVKLPCSPDGVEGQFNLQINLIKANRTKITESSIQEFHTDMMCMEEMQSSTDGQGVKGIAGGFIGLDQEGYVIQNQMIQADEIRGASGKIGEFIGQMELSSHYQEETQWLVRKQQLSDHRQENADLKQGCSTGREYFRQNFDREK